MATPDRLKYSRIALCAAALTVATAASAGTAAAASQAGAQAKPAPAAASAGWRMEASDGTLKGALQRWSQAAGWQLVWELPVDFAIEARADVAGSFEEAVSTVVHSMDGSEMPVKVIFYRGNKVLRVVAKGAQ